MKRQALSSMSTWSEEGDAMFVTVTGGSGSGKSAFAGRTDPEISGEKQALYCDDGLF